MPDTAAGHSPTGGALDDVLLSARTAGFLGPGPIARHVAHAQGFVALARRLSADLPHAGPARLLDLGSGGGLPGLVIATEWPSSTLVLLDANQRRTAFLSRAVFECGLGDRVSVVEERAEVAGRDPSYRGTFDGVVVRSFGPPSVVAECAAPFLRIGGWLVVSEPPEDVEGDPGPEGQAEESGATEAAESAARWPAESLGQFGLEPVEFVRAGFGYQVLRQLRTCPDQFPRRNGVPAKKPLF